MDEERKDNALHLPSLSISGFRGIDDLTIERMGRVTLLAGKNSVGKTTVLDAVRVYASRAHRVVVNEMLAGYGEVARGIGTSGGDTLGPCYETIFNGRDASEGGSLAIGPDRSKLLVVETAEHRPPTWRVQSWDLPAQVLHIKWQGQLLATSGPFCPYALSTGITRTRLVFQDGWPQVDAPDGILAQSIGPGLLSDEETATCWNAIVLTAEEDRMVNTLQAILGNELVRVAIIGKDSHDRRVMVKLRDQAFPVPLKSLGEGAMRLFGLALALANSRDGFLLIDEVENGIHHSVQRDLWHMVLKAAEANNVQVIATTHSFDCVRGFAQATADCPDIEGALVRLERKNGEMWAVEYSESDLKIAAEQGIEVR